MRLSKRDRIFFAPILSCRRRASNSRTPQANQTPEGRAVHPELVLGSASELPDTPIPES